MLRSSLLFIHVLAAMGVFTALGIEALALVLLRRAADRSGVRSALGAVGVSQRVGGPSTLPLLLSGLYLATVYWRWQGAWIGLGLVGMVLIGAVGGLLTGRRVARLGKRVADERFDVAGLRGDPALWTSFAIRAALLAGVVFLMTVKPGLAGSLAALGTAMVAGFLVSLSGGRSRRLPDQASPMPARDAR